MTVTLSGIAAGGESEVSAGIAASVDASTLAKFGYARTRLGLSARVARQLVVIRMALPTNEWLTSSVARCRPHGGAGIGPRRPNPDHHDFCCSLVSGTWYRD